MPRNNYPEDPDYYFEQSGYPEPTQAARYRTAPALVAAGALAVAVLGIAAFVLLKLGPSSSTPTAATSSTTPTSSTAATTTAAAAPAPTHRSYSGSGGVTTVVTQAPQTVTETDTPVDTGTTAVPTTTEPTTTVAPTTDTSTVTQTVTVAPSRQQFFPRQQDQGNNH